jgi:hypothetical protein
MPVTVTPHGDAGLTPVFFKQVLVSTTVLALEIPDGIIPRRVVLTVHPNALRVRWDGKGVPTTTEGHQLVAGSGPSADVARGYELIGEPEIRGFRMIRNGSTDSETAYTIEV